MPELPEVETIVRGMRAKLLNRTIASARVIRPLVVKEAAESFEKKLHQRHVVDIRRHGKSIFVVLNNQQILKIHLGMTGQVLFPAKSVPPDAYVRVSFDLDSAAYNMVYRDVRQFGALRFVAESKESTWGPDAWDAPEQMIVEALQRKSGMVKHALLNQQVIAGVGNIYADESLHMAKIHPKKKIERLKKADVVRLAQAVRAVLKRSLDLGGTSFRNYTDTDGGRGGFKERLRVYGKQGTACMECGAIIRRVVVASRGTHFCPGCQKIGNSR